MFRWKKCVALSSSDTQGFGMAAGHAYIKENFDEDATKIVSFSIFAFYMLSVFLHTNF